MVYLENDMPVFLTDFTNKVWATESPIDGYLQVGLIGRTGYRVEDLLAFVASRDKQFKAFQEKKAESSNGKAIRRNLQPPKDRGVDGSGDAQGSSGERSAGGRSS